MSGDCRLANLLHHRALGDGWSRPKSKRTAAEERRLQRSGCVELSLSVAASRRKILGRVGADQARAPHSGISFIDARPK